MKKALKFSLWGGLITSALVSIYSLFLTIRGLLDCKEYIEWCNSSKTHVQLYSFWEITFKGYMTNINWLESLLTFIFFAFIAVCLLLVILDLNGIIERYSKVKKEHLIEKAQKQQKKVQQVLEKYNNEQ